MSQENVEILRRLYDAFNRGDLDKLIESFSEEAQQVVTVLGQTHHGRAAIRRSFEEYFEVVHRAYTEPVEFIEEGEEDRRSGPVARSPAAHRHHRRDDPNGDGACLRHPRRSGRVERHCTSRDEAMKASPLE